MLGYLFFDRIIAETSLEVLVDQLIPEMHLLSLGLPKWFMGDGVFPMQLCVFGSMGIIPIIAAEDEAQLNIFRMH